ncbi:MAG: sortase, partial [Rubrobacteraceae bacterium]
MPERDPLFRAGVIGLVVALGLAAFAVGLGLFVLRDAPEAVVASSEQEPTFESLTRTNPPGEAWREEDETSPRPEREEEPAPQPEPEPTPPRPADPLPVEAPDWPEPEQSEIEEVEGDRDYGALPSGAVLGLTVEALGIHNAPVWGSDSPEYLDRGVVHIPETSLPWSDTPERNTFLAAHRIGYPGTESRLLFYNLDQLAEGDRIVLENPGGQTYEYEVSEMLVVSPYDSWVMGRVVDRDMLSLQTCTPIPTFEQRL